LPFLPFFFFFATGGNLPSDRSTPLSAITTHEPRQLIIDVVVNC
jgi:hypothetical protein